MSLTLETGLLVCHSDGRKITSAYMRIHPVLDLGKSSGKAAECLAGSNHNLFWRMTGETGSTGDSTG